MAHVFNYKVGNTDVRQFPVASASVIYAGDIVHYNSTSDAIESASTIADGGQATLHNGFVGVALSDSLAGDTTPIAVATKGDFEFDVAALGGAVEVGELVAGADSGVTNMLPQKVATNAFAGNAIGHVSRNGAAGDTKLRVSILSTKVHGGVQTVDTTTA